MRGMRRTGVIALVAMLLLAGCSGRVRTVSLEMVATSDVHGNLFPYDYLGPAGTARDGSLARVSAWLRQERKDQGDNLLYFDLGDNLQGNALAYQDCTADYSGISLPAKVLNELGCDVAALGNGDIKAGIATIDKYVTTAAFPVVCANLFFSDTQITFLEPYQMIERDGVRIAVVGMTTPAVRAMIPKASLNSLYLKSIAESSDTLVRYIREKEHPHLIVGLFHSGLEGGVEDDGIVENEVLQVARRSSGYDVIFFGHDHSPYCGKVADCDGDSVLLINPGPYAGKVARVRLNVQVQGDNLLECGITGELVDMAGVEPDGRLIAANRDRIDALWHYQDSVAGKIDFEIDGAEALCGPSMLSGYFASAMRRFSGNEIMLVSQYDASLHIDSGNVTMRDLQRLFPSDDQITTLMLKGSDVVRILENSSAAWLNTIHSSSDTLLNIVCTDDGYSLRHNVSELISAYGIDYTVDVSKPAGNRIKVLSMSDGKAFDPDKRYRVGLSSLFAAGGSPRFCEYAEMTGPELRRFETLATSADFRFHLITGLGTNAEKGKTVHADKPSNWRIIPEQLARPALKRDLELLGY